MNDPERSMNATNLDPDEATAVSALAAHPWPDFGPALQARLLMIPTLAGEPSSDAVAGPVPKVTDVTTRRGAPRDSRAWRREAWATAAVLATVAALALAAVGTARLRQARPVQEPSAVPPTPAATDAAIAPVEGMTNTSGLTGRLIYIKPAEGDGNATVFALDMRTGREERLWEAPGSDEGAAWAVSPDGRWLAYARGADFGRPRVIQVRSLDPDVAGEGATAASKAGGGTIVLSPEDSAIPEGSGTYERVNAVVWSSDSSAVYYDTLGMQETFPGAMASFSGWELHELSVGDRATARNEEAAVGIPPSTPTPAGDDRVVARLDAAAIAAPDGMQLASLVAVDAVNHRAVVADGPGENGQVDAIALFDTNTGLEVQRIPTGFVEGFRATANRSGTAVIYSDCTGCDGADTTLVGRMLTPATGEVIDLWSGRDSSLRPTRFVWSSDEHWLAWTTGYPGVNKLAEVSGAASRTEDLPAALGDPIAFAPDGGRLLMSTGQWIDLNAPTTGPREGQRLPWRLAGWMSERDAYMGRFFAWLPDIDDGAAAAQAPTPTSETSSYPVGTLVASAVVLTPVATVAAAEGQLLGVTRLEPWSPDGRWLPYWLSSGYVAPPSVEPAQLWFLDARSDTSCVQAGIRRRSHADRVFWQPDGRVVVRVDGVPSIGQPCGGLSPMTNSTLALPTARPAETPAWAVPLERGQQMLANESRVVEGNTVEDRSPDGLWLATTAPIDGTRWSFRQRPRRYITTITSVVDGRRVADKMWERAEATEDWNPATAGTWLPSGAYLIFRTADRGPLLFTTDGTVQPADEALFGVPSPPGDPSSRRVRIEWAADGEEWHAVLEGYGHLRLYHPEIPVVEDLPHDIFIGADDGPLLVIGDDAGPNHLPDPSGRWYARQLDAVDAPFTPVDAEQAILAMGVRSVQIAPDGRTVALHDMSPELVTLHRFADLDTDIGRWRLDGYEISQLTWSPDGLTLAIEGYLADPLRVEQARALFLFHPPSAP